MSFTEFELQYLQSQKLGRLATVDAKGIPQNNPVSFRVNQDLGTIDIGGRAMGKTRKYRNVRRPHAWVSLVVDDIASLSPWRVRGIEIRGTAEAIDNEPGNPNLSPEIIRIHPRRVITWGIVPGFERQEARDIEG